MKNVNPFEYAVSGTAVGEGFRYVYFYMNADGTLSHHRVYHFQPPDDQSTPCLPDGRTLWTATTNSVINDEVRDAVSWLCNDPKRRVWQLYQNTWDKPDWAYLFVNGPRYQREISRMRVKDTDDRLPQEYRAMKLLGLI